MVRFTCICWSITSETSTRQGSRVLRQGRFRPFSSNQGIKALRTASSFAVSCSGSKPIEYIGCSLTSGGYS
jgi:hypothetical protein